jgi:hypothetical protein
MLFLFLVRRKTLMQTAPLLRRKQFLLGSLIQDFPVLTNSVDKCFYLLNQRRFFFFKTTTNKLDKHHGVITARAHITTIATSFLIYLIHPTPVF